MALIQNKSKFFAAMVVVLAMVIGACTTRDGDAHLKGITGEFADVNRQVILTLTGKAYTLHEIKSGTRILTERGTVNPRARDVHGFVTAFALIPTSFAEGAASHRKFDVKSGDSFIILEEIPTNNRDPLRLLEDPTTIDFD